ncbi:M48 family metalloprotease [Allohahella marinimesophila]|uniref:M48 family metallopeptidase n=1 Tax=Allohahella marinimesophila TaxID=1054972 RepID=A0ABP7P3Z6_9GAMM
MDFFQRQADARRLSFQLCVYFVLAVVGILAAVNVLPFLAFNRWLKAEPQSFAVWMTAEGLYISLFTLATFLYGSWTRAQTIERGGEHLAAAAGGQLVERASQAPEVQRFVHVVEEMSIASGVPPPQMYIMPREAGLNAFVAGLSRDDAVLVVTRGLIDGLSRDELQSVVAHEFSHIAHEDMRLNSRIIIMLGGIMMIGSTGRRMISSERRQRWYSRGAQSDVRLFPIGLLLWVAGSIGTLSGRVIQAAICRQREYLADAASVQYTRQPGSLASALHKLMTAEDGTGLRHAAMAGELNHMCIGESLSSHRWFASHPPLTARISAVDASFMRSVRIRRNQQSLEQRRAARNRHADLSSDAGSTAPAATTTQAVSARVGHWGEVEMAWAIAVRLGLVEQFGSALDRVDAAAPLLVELLGSGFRDLEAQGPGKAARLPLLEWLTGTLKQMPDADRERLLGQVSEAAGQAPVRGLTNVCFVMYLNHHLCPKRHGLKRKRVKRYDTVAHELAVLLSLFSRLGCSAAASVKDNPADEPAARLFAVIALQWFPLLTLEFRSRSTAAELELALQRLAQLPPLLKPALIDACAMAVRHDDRIDVGEYELLRISCELLGCPLPPQMSADYTPRVERPPLQFDKSFLN